MLGFTLDENFMFFQTLTLKENTMTSEKNLATECEKIKASPYWREDFQIVEVKNVGNLPVYYITANDQEPSTILAIAKLNELLCG